MQSLQVYLTRKTLILLGLSVTVLIIPITYVVSHQQANKQEQSSSQQPTTSGFSVPTASTKISFERDIKTAFTSSKHKDIITYIQLASTEKDKAVRYSYYVKAYAKMLSFYNSSRINEKNLFSEYNEAKDPKMKQAIVELKDYTKKTFKQFKESDFPPPN